MEKVSGIVQSVSISPGRPDTISVLFENETGSGNLMNAADGEVICDGVRSNPLDLFMYLIVKQHPIRATLYPSPKHYGVAMEAEFTSSSKGVPT